MTDEEIAARLAEHKQRMVNFEERLHKQETKVDKLLDLTGAVAHDTKELNRKQDKMNERLEEIEKRPARAWNTMTRTIFTTVVSAVAGGLAVWIVQALTETVH